MMAYINTMQVRDLMQQQSISQSAMAKQIGISRQELNNMFRYKDTHKYHTWFALMVADILGVELNDISRPAGQELTWIPESIRQKIGQEVNVPELSEASGVPVDELYEAMYTQYCTYDTLDRIEEVLGKVCKK